MDSPFDRRSGSAGSPARPGSALEVPRRALRHLIVACDQTVAVLDSLAQVEACGARFMCNYEGRRRALLLGRPKGRNGRGCRKLVRNTNGGAGLLPPPQRHAQLGR